MKLQKGDILIVYNRRDGKLDNKELILRLLSQDIESFVIYYDFQAKKIIRYSGSWYNDLFTPDSYHARLKRAVVYRKIGKDIQVFTNETSKR